MSSCCLDENSSCNIQPFSNVYQPDNEKSHCIWCSNNSSTATTLITLVAGYFALVILLKYWRFLITEHFLCLQVMPFSTACNTPLSNFESGQNYKEVQDPSGKRAPLFLSLDFGFRHCGDRLYSLENTFELGHYWKIACDIKSEIC